MEKQCSVCKIAKPITEFSKNKWKRDGLQTKCKTCNSKLIKEYYERNREKHRAATREQKRKCREKIRSVLLRIRRNNPCCMCGENDPVCLDFHHVEPKTKVSEVSTLAAQLTSIETILKEVSKCVIVCSNCHKKIHAKKITLPRNALTR